jgi:predicted secreted hydrolase
VRTGIDEANPSRFAAKQLMIAHAALADPRREALVHDQSIVRTGLGIAGFAEADTDVYLDRWRLRRNASGAYECTVPARGFTLELEAHPTQPPIIQGNWRGPAPEDASYYYSQPHLQVEARLKREDGIVALSGSGWLDHEWSSRLIPDRAAGWDWVGMNLSDGSALTAAQVRSQTSPEILHAYASFRPPGQPVRLYQAADVRFTPIAFWTSPRTGARWPVAQRIQISNRVFVTQPLFNDQELDSRATTGAVYWEGASRLFEGGRAVGRGYLEMVGYVAPIRL